MTFKLNPLIGRREGGPNQCTINAHMEIAQYDPLIFTINMLLTYVIN
jgi:hypothetical protein